MRCIDVNDIVGATEIAVETEHQQHVGHSRILEDEELKVSNWSLCALVVPVLEPREKIVLDQFHFPMHCMIYRLNEGGNGQTM